MTVDEFNRYVEAYNDGVKNGADIVYVNNTPFVTGFLHYWIQSMYEDVMLKEK